MIDQPETPTALAPVSEPDPAAAAPAVKVPTAIGLMPTTIDQAWRLAQIMAKAHDMVPKAYHEKPEAVMVALMYGAEVGLTPAQAITGIAVINGRPGLYGDALMAVIKSSPLYAGHAEWFEVDGQQTRALTADDLKKGTTTAICTFYRKGEAAGRTAAFSVADAQRARLIGKAGPWTVPQIMLRWRARNFAARDQFPDVLRGITTVEELQDIPTADVIPVPVVPRLSQAQPEKNSANFLEKNSQKNSVPEQTHLAPSRVADLIPFLDHHVLTLGTGVRVLVPLAADAAELRKFLGTDHQLRVTAQRGPADELILQEFKMHD